METLFAIVVIAIIPVLLWLVPKWRNRDGKWIVPFKIVPLGCLTMLIVPELCLAAVRLLRKISPISRGVFAPLVFGIAGIIAGIFVIKKVSQLHWTRHPDSPYRDKYTGFRMGSVFVLFVLIGWFAMAVGVIGYYKLQLEYPQYFQQPWHSYALPAAGKIEFSERSIHPFLAEYDYAFVFDGERRQVHTNCGGRTAFNFYQLADGRYLWIDKDARYLLEPTAHRALKLIDHKGKLYTVEVPNEPISSWGGCDGKIYSFNGHNVPLVPADGILENKRYLGRGTSFGFDAKAPETEIKPAWKGRYD